MEKLVRARLGAIICFVVGLLLFLTQTRSSGEAPETLRFFVDKGILLVIGIALVGISVVFLALSLTLFREKPHHR